MCAKIIGKRYTQEESADWLVQRLAKLNISTNEEFASMVGIDRGTISQYFRFERRPSIDVIARMCEILQVSPETLLIALGAIDKK